MPRQPVSSRPDVFQAIGDPTRRALLDFIATGEHPVKSLSAQFAMTRPAVSQHLRVLHEAGLVTEQKVGRERFYRLRPEGLQQISAWVQHYERFWDNHLAALGEQLDNMP